MSKRYLPMSPAELAIETTLQDIEARINRLRRGAKIGGYVAELAEPRIAELTALRNKLKDDARMEYHATVLRDLVGDSIGDALIQAFRPFLVRRAG